MRGIFYNSPHSLCSIWESGKMCYDALKKSDKYTLTYSENSTLDFSFDFAIINQHFTVNNWLSEELVKQFNKPIFCIVTEVSFFSNPIEFSPPYFSDYIVLDSTINETDKIHSFGRPIEDFELKEELIYDIPRIFSFGMATHGKEWSKIVELVQNDYDNAFIHFNIPQGTHVPSDMHNSEITNIITKCKNIINKPGIKLKITHDNLTKHQLIELCSKQTINCFIYNRQHLFGSGLSAVTDQAISSGIPLLVSDDRAFRHIHKYIDYHPKINIKTAIEKNKEGVLQMKKDWSMLNFLTKFEKILLVKTN